MATQRYISTSFWDDEWIQTLDPSEKLLYLYLMTNPLTTISGAYKISLRRMVFDTGFNEDTIKRILDKFQAKKKAYHYQEYMILPSWPKHQKWEKKATIKAGIDSDLENIPDEVKKYMVSIGYKYPIIGYEYSPSYSDSDLHSDIDTDSDIDSEASATPSPVFSKAEALNPNIQNSEQRFQQLKTSWNANCKPACNIKSTIYMNYAQREDWNAGESQMVNIFATCKAIQNYGGIQSSKEYELDNHSGYSMLSFLVKGVEWYTDEADPWSRCRKKPAAKQVERDLVPAEPNPFDAKDPFGGE